MTTGTESLTITRTFRAPRERVYAAFTEASTFARWWGPSGTTNTDVVLDARVGGRFSTRMHLPPGAMGAAEGMMVGVSGEFTRVEPQRLLAYTFQWEGEDLVTHVSLEFEDAGDGGTRVTLRHDGFPSAEQVPQHEHGWNASFDRLGALLD